MSIIGVRGILPKMTLMNVVKILAKTINGHFEALNFKSGGKSKKFPPTKICYLRLSEKLDPVRVVEKINTTSFPGKFRPFAFIPDHVPDIPLAVKPKKLSNVLSRKLRIPDDDPPDQVLALANAEIMTEMQCKYPGLYRLSQKMDHKVLEEIAMKIRDRLNVIADANPETLESAFKLTQYYRKMHPHFGDFQLVLSTVHALEDAAGAPRTQLQEKELAAMPAEPGLIDNLPFKKVQQACHKYSERITKKITEHLNNLNSEILPTDNGEEVVTKRVRDELKKLTPFLPVIVKQVVTNHFIPEKQPYKRVRIYGEPFLPSKDTMTPFTRRYGAVRVIRSTRMYNMLRLNVPPANYASLLAMDGTVLNGAKLVIRSSDMPQYKASVSLCAGDDPETLMEAMEEAEQWEETQ